MPKIRAGGVGVVGTGGTIQNTMAGRIDVGSLLGEVFTVANGADVAALLPTIRDDVLTVGSEDLEPSDWLVIARRVQDVATRPDVDGVVVTHGTYTAEETSYFLHLCVQTEKPIVVACSQRRHGVVGNDGDRNLIDAIRVAMSPEARGIGCVLDAGEEIHSAREVLKSSQRPGGFNSGPLGVIGTVEEDAVSIYRTPTRRHTSRSEFSAKLIQGDLPVVEIVNTYPGAGTEALRAVESGSVDGVVINGYTPRGSPTREQRTVLHDLVDRGKVAAVVVGRGRWGRVPGLESGARWITGDNLSPYKARILLMVALAAGITSSSLQRIYNEY